MSPGRCALGPTIFSTLGITPVTGMGGLSSAMARMAPITAAPPHISYFMRSIFSEGLIEMPPVSKVTALPTSPRFVLPGGLCAPDGSVRTINAGGSALPCDDAQNGSHPEFPHARFVQHFKSQPAFLGHLFGALGEHGGRQKIGRLNCRARARNFGFRRGCVRASTRVPVRRRRPAPPRSATSDNLVPVRSDLCRSHSKSPINAPSTTAETCSGVEKSSGSRNAALSGARLQKARGGTGDGPQLRGGELLGGSRARPSEYDAPCIPERDAEERIPCGLPVNSPASPHRRIARRQRRTLFEFQNDQRVRFDFGGRLAFQCDFHNVVR